MGHTRLLLLLHCPKYRTDDDFEAAREAVDDMKSSYEALRDKCTEEELPELDEGCEVGLFFVEVADSDGISMAFSVRFKVVDRLAWSCARAL